MFFDSVVGIKMYNIFNIRENDKTIYHRKFSKQLELKVVFREKKEVIPLDIYLFIPLFLNSNHG